MADESFGSLLRLVRRNTRDPLHGGPLSQSRLADLLSDDAGIVYSRAAISDWERDKGHIHKDDRPVLVSLLRVLHTTGGLTTRQDAERWLAAGNYRALDSAEAALINPAWNTPPTATAGGVRPFLPPLLPHHPIVGRGAALGQLKSWLFDGRSLALSSINGLPGVGKTALALLAAHDDDVRQRFPDGVLWVGLGTNPDIFGLLGLWATAVGISEEELAALGAQRLRSEAIHQAIRHKEMLLVIDDVWHSDHALPFRLGGRRSAHILTSRQPPIAAAFGGPHALTVRELSPEQGLELLRWLAPQAVGRDEAAARELVAATGGLPLSLVLLGNELRLYGLSGSDRRIHAAMQALANASARLALEQAASPLESELHPSLPPGLPVSLGAIIQASVERLSASAAAALLALALFPPKPNHFSEAAALAVADVSTDVIDELVDHGLLESTRKDRYTLHQSIHDYARLHQPEPDAAARFLSFALAFIEAHQDERPVLEQELENIRAALQLAEASGDQDMLWALLEALLPFFDDRGYYDVALTLLEKIDRLSSAVNPAIKHHLGRLEMVLEHDDVAQGHLESGLAAARHAGDNAMAGRLLTSLSQIASRQRRFADAVAYLEEAAQAAEAAGDWFEVCRALGNRGRVAWSADDYVTAERDYRRALAVARAHEYESMISGILNLLGIVAVDTGRYEEALQAYREGLDMARAHRLDGRTSTLLANMGELLNDMGRHAEAEAYLEEGIAIARRLNDEGQVGHMLMDLGVAAAALGRYEAATASLEEARSIAATLMAPWQEAYVAARWGIVALEAGDMTRARTLLETAVGMAPDIASSAHVEGLGRFGLARLALSEGDATTADAQSATALAVLESSGHALAADVAAWRVAAGFPAAGSPAAGSPAPSA